MDLVIEASKHLGVNCIYLFSVSHFSRNKTLVTEQCIKKTHFLLYMSSHSADEYDFYSPWSSYIFINEIYVMMTLTVCGSKINISFFTLYYTSKCGKEFRPFLLKIFLEKALSLLLYHRQLLKLYQHKSAIWPRWNTTARTITDGKSNRT